ncbi:MAG: hypothetical protein CSA21_08110 [Deltaproteobacteria bacterium]|nr:MAG: hypothetical protein CSA21_08110 [Deltaproteobacteria bacterium]
MAGVGLSLQKRFLPTGDAEVLFSCRSFLRQSSTRWEKVQVVQTLSNAILPAGLRAVEPAADVVGLRFRAESTAGFFLIVLHGNLLRFGGRKADHKARKKKGAVGRLLSFCLTSTTTHSYHEGPEA